MADDLMNLFNQFDEIFPTTERVFLPLANPFYDLDKKFKERFRLSKHVVQCLVDEIIDSNCCYKLCATFTVQPIKVSSDPWLV